VWSDKGLRECCVRYVSDVIHSSLASDRRARDARWSDEFENMPASDAAGKGKLKRDIWATALALWLRILLTHMQADRRMFRDGSLARAIG
jgi:hypothetical protein